MALALTLRPATAEDAPYVWRWRDDPESRAASRNTGKIPYPAHEAWFLGALEDPDRTLLIGVGADGEAVGMVRFDRRSGGASYVSIAVAADRRGLGVGRSLLRAALERAGRPLRAEVRAGNIRSIRLFEGAGFARLGEAEGMVLFGLG